MEKRIIALITVVVMVMSLAGCAGTKIDGINMTLEEFRTSVNEVYSERTGIETDVIDEFVKEEDETSGETKYEYYDDCVFFDVQEDGSLYLSVVILYSENRSDYTPIFERWLSLIDSTILVLNPDYEDIDLLLIRTMTDVGSTEDSDYHSYGRGDYSYGYMYYGESSKSFCVMFSITQKN